MNAARPVRSRLLGPVLSILLALALYLTGLGIPVVQREQELRVALTARAMAEGGSWLNPTYLGEPRIRKPPMMYWLVAVSYLAGDSTQSATLARLPSAVSAVALAWLVFHIGRSLRGRRTGLLAALICATTLIVFRQARLAETDILLTLWTTLAMWHGYRAFFLRGGWHDLLFSALAAGAGFLTKGPAALALPLACWALLFVFRKPRIANGGTLTGMIIWLGVSIAVGLSWYLYLFIQADSLGQLHQELAATYGDETGHPGPWFYYAYALFHAFAPWSLLLPGVLWYGWRKVRSRGSMRFPAAAFFTGILLLSLTNSKQLHYAALLAPGFSLLAAGFLGLLARRHAWLHPFARVSPAVAMILVLVNVGAAAVVMPSLEARQIVARQLRSQLGALAEIDRLFLVGRHRATVEFHAGRPVRDIDNLREAWRLSNRGDLIAVNTTAETPPTPPGPVDILAEGRHRGLHAALWRRR